MTVVQGTPGEGGMQEKNEICGVGSVGSGSWKVAKMRAESAVPDGLAQESHSSFVIRHSRRRM